MLRKDRLTLLPVAVGLIALVFASTVDAQGPRLVVRLDEPFEVRGQVYPGGSLMLRPVTDFNPSASIDEVWVDNESLGLLVASKTSGTRSSSHDSVLFERNAQGRLVLVGYNLRGNGTGASYRYRGEIASRTTRAVSTIAAR